MRLSDLNIYDIGNKIGLTGAVFGDDDNTYLCMFPDQEVHAQEILQMDLDDWTKFLRQTDLLEVEIITKAEDGKLAKAILRKTQRLIERKISWSVFRRDGYRCRYCGRDDVPLTVDHLVLWEDNGPTIEANLLAVCTADNRARGNTHYAEWLESKKYRTLAEGLTPEVRQANDALVATLADIPRDTHKRSRGKKKGKK